MHKRHHNITPYLLSATQNVIQLEMVLLLKAYTPLCIPILTLCTLKHWLISLCRTYDMYHRSGFDCEL